MASNVFHRVLQPARSAAGLEWVGIHTLRHTAATLLFAEGRNVKQVQDFLGHQSPSFTLDTYVGLLDGDVGGPLAVKGLAGVSRRRASRHERGGATLPGPFKRWDRVVQANDERQFAATVVLDDGTQAEILILDLDAACEQVKLPAASAQLRLATPEEIAESDERLKAEIAKCVEERPRRSG